MATPTSNPNYVNYSTEQLERARRSIDAEQFPDRTHLLDVLIADRKQRHVDAALAAASTSAPVNEAVVATKLAASNTQQVPPVALSPAGQASLRRILGGLTIWGGIGGVLAVFMEMPAANGLLGWTFITLFAGLFSWSIACGVQLLEGQPGAIHRNQLLWALQVPVVSFPWLNYTFASGAISTLWIRLDEFSFGINFHLGTQAQLRTAVTDGALLIGVNLFALLIIGLLVVFEDSVKLPVLVTDEAIPEPQDNSA